MLDFGSKKLQVLLFVTGLRSSWRKRLSCEAMQRYPICNRNQELACLASLLSMALRRFSRSLKRARSSSQIVGWSFCFEHQTGVRCMLAGCDHRHRQGIPATGHLGATKAPANETWICELFRVVTCMSQRQLRQSVFKMLQRRPGVKASACKDLLNLS